MLAFNNFVAIDWSGAQQPLRTHAISLAQCEQGVAAPHVLPNKLSRQQVFDHLSDLLQTANKTSLVGIDANLGYAHTMAVALCGNNYTAPKLWQLVEDVCQQAPNFFAGPMWQYPNWATFYWVSGKRPANWLPQYHRRLTETACAQQGLGHPENPFKLLGTKQVGRGGLSAMRVLHQLKQQFGDALCVWPFEQPTSQTRMVLAEIYPRLFLQQVGFGTKKVQSVLQLNHVLKHFNSQNFDATIPLNNHLTDAVVAAAGMRYLTTHHNPWPNLPALAQNEGWIFGVNSHYN